MTIDINNSSYKLQSIDQSAYPLQETGDSYAPLLELVGDASIVLLGEATHGTHEFYRERAQITKLLIRKKGFKAIAIEGDWPDAQRVNRYIRALGNDHEASDALRGYTRFPSWMWANADVLDFVGWLRSYNDSLSTAENPIGFFGLDLYSLYRSASQVIDYLEKVDVAAAARARHRYSCFDRFATDAQAYAYAVNLGLTASCEKAVLDQLLDLLRNANQYQQYSDGRLAEDEFFDAEQNSRLVYAAENYYRTMLRAEVSSWNLRDEHMAQTIDHIRGHLAHQKTPPKIVVWAHNSHVGDARATAMSQRGESNIGQLTKETYGTEVKSIGFTTYTGTVTAASCWDGEAERKTIRPAMRGSYEELFHRVERPRFFLNLSRDGELARVLREPMLERAIGVLYLPDTERQSHYFEASLPEQFDAIIHVDKTRAVEPLEHDIHWHAGEEVPEAYPTGM